MINSYEVYLATCDKCEKPFYDVLEEEFTSISELESALKQHGWESRGYSCLCNECKEK